MCIIKTNINELPNPPLWMVVHYFDGKSQRGLPVDKDSADSIRDALQQRFPDDVINVEKYER